MNTPIRKILVTTALPYANGPLHLGYMVEAIQADIWVRFQKMMGHSCHFISADDAHGTPVMLLAERQGLRPEALIEAIYQSHVKDLAAFEIGFDDFYTSHSPENRLLAETIYEKLLKRGDIIKRTISQAFDPVKQLFLPDRYVKGECPKCAAPNQYGDNCEQCGATYSPMDLRNPLSVLSGVAPIQKESEHHFFCLENYQDFLKTWIEANHADADHVQPEVRSKLSEWFKIGLAQWDISRDAPYFGFKIPGTDNKYFYVWLDAPIAYMATFKHYCDKTGLDFEAYWAKDSSAELYHFMGKDIIYFHGLFWPAILEGAGFRTPTKLFTHGFLTVDGKKMSKSRGTFVQARTYLNHLSPEYLRYYFASKSNDSVEDLDFQAQDFVSKVNADLVGKWANIASRTASFINKAEDPAFKNRLSGLDSTSLAVYQPFADAGTQLKAFYEKRQFNMALQLIMQLSDQVNQYIDANKPWVLAKSQNVADRLKGHPVCSLSLNLFWLLTIYLSPVIPSLAAKAARFLGKDLDWHQHWETRHIPFQDGHQIETFEPLVQRIDLKTVEAMMMESQADLPKNPFDASSSDPSKSITPAEPVRATIHIDQFSQIDLRVGKVLHAEAVPEAQKLIKLQVDIGLDRPIQIFAGIKEAYEPEMLIGKLVAVVANLEPRKMRFGLSEGMLLATSGGGTNKSKVWIIEPNAQSMPGMSIK
jgi:methionyl-tRNA synthetase